MTTEYSRENQGKEIKSIIESYKNQLKFRNNPVNSLKEKITKKLDLCGIYYKIDARIKDFDSLDRKLSNKWNDYKKNNTGIQDLIGMRIILYYEDDIPICERIITQEVGLENIVYSNAIDKLSKDEFKPRRRNWVFKIPDDILDEFNPPFSKDFENKYRITQCFEIQFRTVFSDGWLEIEHDIRYKCKDEWEQDSYYDFNRQLNGLMATLEGCDNRIIDILDKVMKNNIIQGNMTSFIRNKFRIKFEPSNSVLSDAIVETMMQDPTTINKILEIDRSDFLVDLASGLCIPEGMRSMDNIVHICNYVYCAIYSAKGSQGHNFNIEELMDEKLKNYIDSNKSKLRERRKERA